LSLPGTSWPHFGHFLVNLVNYDFNFVSLAPAGQILVNLFKLNYNSFPPSTSWSNFSQLGQPRFQFCPPWHQLATFWSYFGQLGQTQSLVCFPGSKPVNFWLIMSTAVPILYNLAPAGHIWVTFFLTLTNTILSLSFWPQLIYFWSTFVSHGSNLSLWHQLVKF
jgi:hypothetical protein